MDHPRARGIVTRATLVGNWGNVADSPALCGATARQQAPDQAFCKLRTTDCIGSGPEELKD